MAIKKVVVAAAGRGTRMLHLSKDKPKHLIEINGRPFLAYVLDNLIKAGYNDIILVGGYMGELIEHFAKNYTPSNKGEFKIKFVDQFKNFNPKEKYGTACTLMAVEREVSEPFLFVGGDNLFSVNDLEAMNVDDNFNYVAGLEHEHPENYGVLISDGEYLEKIVEKPKEYVGNIINAGLYKFMPEVFEKLSLINKSPRGEYEITDIISLLAKDKKVKVKKLTNYWKDFGRPEDVQELSEFLGKSKFQNENNKGK